MAKLHYVSVMSLDGYIGNGHYDWSIPVEGSTAFITEVMRPIGTYLYGRKNYETMSFWENPVLGTMGSEHQDFTHVWQSAEKIVYSKSLKLVTTQKTRLEKDFDVQKIREMKRDLTKIFVSAALLLQPKPFVIILWKKFICSLFRQQSVTPFL